MGLIAAYDLSITLDDQAADRYPELGFELGAADSVEVTLDYDRGAAVIDLGCTGPQGWVGWSGGARDSYVIEHESATPGYLPGLSTGDWAVVLGLHKLPADPLPVRIEVHSPARRPVDAGGTLGDRTGWPTPPDTPRGSARELPCEPGLRWFAGDLHSHSVHSDGTLQLAQLAAAATGRGLDFLAVTEHNTTSHFAHLPGVAEAYGIGLIAGQEVTTHRGHANAFGEIGFVDFRQPAPAWLDAVEADCGLLSINHPLQDDCAWQHPLDRLPPLLEFWHISWFLDLLNTAPWAWWQRWDRTATIIGGSDFHDPAQGYPPGTPTTWVAAAEPSPAAILDGIRAGRTAISRFPGPGEPVLLRVEDELIAIDAEGCILVDEQGHREVVRADRQSWAGREGLQRLVAADGTMLAVCQAPGS